MLFNSIDFAVFLPIVFLIYWTAARKSSTAQNLFLIAVSFFFYGWWNWHYLFLIFISMSTDFTVGRLLGVHQNKTKRKLLLWLSIIVNLGLLGFFKYYNFFVQSFVDAFTLFGVHPNVPSLQILLPVGISFYTFQTLSYVIDVYRKLIQPAHNPITYFAYISFFPQLFAGPIERAGRMLPQFGALRTFNYSGSVDGIRQILWGLFKKIVVADNCATYVKLIFDDPSSHSGSTLLVGAVFFAFQIYGDFSGYSDIAIGTARLFGFSIAQNFAFPYFSRSIGEFWRRWHISLTSWLRDYVFFPIGGVFGNNARKIRNILVLFFVSGLWHGASWTFIAWGVLNGIYFIPSLLRSTSGTVHPVAEGKVFPGVKEFFQILFTFFLTTFAWIFFRADSLSDAGIYISGIFSMSLFSMPAYLPLSSLLPIALLLIVEWIQREKLHGLDFSDRHIPQPVRIAIYYGLVAVIFAFGGNQQVFLYFQF